MIQQDRLNHQHFLINKWIDSGCQSSIEAYTGFGKTNLGLIAIEKLKSKTIIVVPTEVLKDQWDTILKQHSVKDYEILIINTAYRNQYNCDFLILDEIHRYAAEEFKKVFRSISYNKILGLTATLERQDNKHAFLLEKAPIIERVNLAFGIANKWAAPYIIYNLSVEFTQAEKKIYEKADGLVKFLSMRLTGNSRKSAFDIAMRLKNSGSKEAFPYFNALRKRKKICVGAKNKINICSKLIKKYKEKKILVFSEEIKFIQDLNKKVSGLIYHSKLKDPEKLKAIKNFGKTSNLLLSAQALRVGIDIPNLEVGISASGNSNSRDFIQELGRVSRFLPDKQALFFNLYAKDSQEKNWVEKKTKGFHVNWIESVEEIE